MTANNVTLGADSTLNISGYSAPDDMDAASKVYSEQTVIATTDGFDGTFKDVTVGGEDLSNGLPDYISGVNAKIVGNDFKVGLGLSWFAGSCSGETCGVVDPGQATGSFTLAKQSDAFDVDVVLEDQAANSKTGWDGKSLTKNGLGTLTLSENNTYTGDTIIEQGSLKMGIADAITTSASVTLKNTDSVLDLNDFDQTINNLNGAGNVSLGGATLTNNLSEDNELSGVISGSGSGSGNVELNGAGYTYTLSNDNTYTGTTTVGDGVTLQLGKGGETGSVVGDILDDGTVIFNRSNALIYSGEISGAGDVIKESTNSLVLNQDQTYTGTTDVQSGALILDHINLASNLVTIDNDAILAGYGSVAGDLTNSGTIAVADAAPAVAGFDSASAGDLTVNGNLTNNGAIVMESSLPQSTLTVNGNYIGNNGSLSIDTVLGGDDSATDRLIVKGDTSGTTTLYVNNAGGSGTLTEQGIEVVDVSGTSNGTFIQGNQVQAGLYEYRLYQDDSNGDWYLRSQMNNSPDTPQYRADTGAYLGNQWMARNLQMQTLFDREGSQLRSADGSVWARFKAGNADSAAENGNIDISNDYSQFQLGTDMISWDNGKQSLVAGIMGSYINANTDSKGNQGADGSRLSASGNVDGYNLGLYATWFADMKDHSGLYVDSWYQYGTYNNSVDDGDVGSENYDSSANAVSLETGWRHDIGLANGNSIGLTPQVQVVWQDYHADSVIDNSGTLIDGQNSDNLTTRLGLRVDGKLHKNASVIQPFLEANWLYTSGNTSVSFDNANANMDQPPNRVQLKAGIQANIDRQWTVTAQVNGEKGSNNYDDLSGSLNLHYNW